jgi:hypothetical protein
MIQHDLVLIGASLGVTNSAAVEALYLDPFLEYVLPQDCPCCSTGIAHLDIQ